jgi:hypothetical protein
MLYLLPAKVKVAADFLCHFSVVTDAAYEKEGW